MKVYWLMVGLCWGLFEVFPLDPILQFEDLEWTFGQVIALLLLAAPVIALIEGYVSSTSSPCMVTVSLGSTS